MEPTIPTLYQWAGGEAALQHLFRTFYDKVLQDDLIGPVDVTMSFIDGKWKLLILSHLYWARKCATR